jgi:phosphomannomutase
MDGTLTEARKPFASFLSSPLWSLGQVADIGVVTGSDLDYVQQQLKSLIENHSIRYCLHILPCNGTKWLKPPEFPSTPHTLVHEATMEKQIGKERYRRLIEILLDLQLFTSDYDIPLTGHFISARGSMINWCPIGRNATNKQRKYFKKFNKKTSLRNQLFMRLRLMLDSNDMQDIIVKLGGDTSFDIYPIGWDKTYALRHFSDRNVWFVGDRALSPKGNDYEIFQACGAQSYHTTSPEKTKDVIESIITRIGETK